MNLKIKPYEDLSEEERIKYIEIGKRILKVELTEIQYYRGELNRIKDELYLFILKLLKVEEPEEIEEDWTKEEYDKTIEKYRNKIKQINEIFNDK